MSRWYRAYEGTVTDSKLSEVALIASTSRSVVIATWHAILENCAGMNEGGRFDITPRRVAAALVEPVEAIELVFSGLSEVGLICDGAVCAWSKRQFESDNSTERSRKRRERQCNADATLLQRCATPPDTETDTETEKKDSGADAPSDWPSNFREVFWETYPRKVGKQGAIRELERVKKRGNVPFDRIISAVKAYAATADPQFTKHPQTWLSKGCWDDEPHVSGKSKNAGNIIAAADNLVERIRALGGPTGVCGSASEAAVRLLPQGRRERSGDVHDGDSGDSQRLPDGNDPMGYRSSDGIAGESS